MGWDNATIPCPSFAYLHMELRDTTRHAQKSGPIDNGQHVESNEDLRDQKHRNQHTRMGYFREDLICDKDGGSSFLAKRDID